MNREKIIENLGRDHEILNRLNNWELSLVNLGDSIVPDLTSKIFHKRFFEIEQIASKERPRVEYYALPLYPRKK